MIPPKIAQLPPAPVRADAPVDFSTKADAMVGAMQPFADQANLLADFVNDRADDANASATSVAGVQSAVSADRVLSQQAASNAAGSAASALASANNAGGSAGAAQLSASAAEDSAVRAEDAAQYVENITDGAAPLNNPNFQGVVRVNDVPLGYAATAPTVGGGDEVLRVGAGGWLGQGEVLATPYGYPVSIDDVTNQTKVISSESVDNSVAEYSTGIHFAAADSWGRLRVSNDTTDAWIQGGDATAGTGWTAELLHTGNILTATGQSTQFPMTQKAVTDAIANIDVSGPRPTKNHGAVATAGSQTVVCNVQESDFHMMSMGSSDATGTLTIDFSNMPDTLGKHFSWHVRLQRGARKTVAFAQTVNWAGGVAPTFGSNTTSQDLMLFYKVDSETIRGMVIDAW